MAKHLKRREPDTVGEALALAHETQKKLREAEKILAILTDAGVRKPAVLGELIGPTARIRDALLRELEVLNELVKKPGGKAD